MNKLKVGDRIYLYHYGEIRRVIIERVTKTMAKSKLWNFDIEYEDNGYVKIKGKDPFTRTYAYIETEKIKDEYDLQNLREWLKKNVDSIPLNKLKEMYKIAKI